jgi:putative hemolysin
MWEAVRLEGSDECDARRVRLDQELAVHLTPDEAKRLPRSGPVVLLGEWHAADFDRVGRVISAIAEHRNDLRVLQSASYAAPNPRMREISLNLADALAWLAAGHAVLCLVDPDRKGYAIVSQLALQSDASVVALHLAQHLGPRGAATSHGPSSHPVEARLASATTVQSLRRLGTEDRQLTYLRWRRHALTHRPSAAAAPSAEATALHAQIAAAVPAHKLAAEVAALGDPLLESGDQAVFVATRARIPYLIEEIGRLREVTFREVGEGTGLSIDLDRFDDHYQHLFVYSRREKSVLGAYRLGLTDHILAQQGPQGLYSATLFDYGPGLLDALSPALELGRSFVRREAQRSSKTLLLLWKGIARFVSENPRYRRLFGPVSISARYETFSRDLIVDVLTGGHRHPLAHLLTPKHPVLPRRTHDGGLGDPHAVLMLPEHLSSVVSDAESDGKGLPTLINEYLKLGGRFLGFNLDPDFCGVTDGLVVVDLCSADRRLLKFYMGARETADFLRHHAVGPEELPAGGE